MKNNRRTRDRDKNIYTYYIDIKKKSNSSLYNLHAREAIA